MASVFVMTDPPTDIDYSIADGRVRSFELRGVVLYDEDSGIAAPGWRDALAGFVREQGLNVPDRRGLHAFVYRLIEDGLITLDTPSRETPPHPRP